MSRRRLLPLLGTLAGLAALAAAWFLLAPTQVGGSTSYSMVIGTSMEPHLHRGDLVLVRRRPAYRVGDVVAYHSRDLGKNVLHRIVGQRDGLWLFKGDANDFVDPDPVAQSDLIGRYWLKIAGGATVLQWVREPLHAALLAGIAGLLLLGGGAGSATRRRRRRRSETPPPASPRQPLLPRTVSPQGVAAGAGVALLACAALGAVAWHAPVTRSVQEPRLFSETGRFSYDAPAPAGAAYPDGRVRSGDAVFTQLVRRLAVRFDWKLETPRPHGVHGTASLTAVVGDGSGWRHRIVLAPERPFAGDRTTLAGTLELDRVRKLLASFERATGTRSGAYTVELAPRVSLAGAVAGEAVRDAFGPVLRLTLDEQRLQVAGSTDPAAPNSLVRTHEVSGVVQAPNRLELLRLSVSLPTARAVAIAGAAVSLLVLVAALAAAAVAGRGDEAQRIRARYGSMIVRVVDEPASERTVHLADFDELARLAERYERLILHCERTGAFVVEDDGVAFRWRADSDGPTGALGRLADLVEQAGEQPLVERRDWSTRPWADAWPEAQTRARAESR